jgi:hypothetical protein
MSSKRRPIDLSWLADISIFSIGSKHQARHNFFLFTETSQGKAPADEEVAS